MNLRYGVLALLVIGIAAMAYQLTGKMSGGTQTMNQSASETPKQVNTPPEMSIDPSASYSAVLHTEQGDIKIRLFADETPVTVNNFVHLARTGFYDNTIFHRIIKGFMIQGGDPRGNGTGGPGYAFDDEPITRDYTRGTVAMANSGPDTNGSQFFIMHEDYDLPKNYVIFGEVTEGMHVVDAIATSPVEMSASGEESSPERPVSVDSVEITEQ